MSADAARLDRARAAKPNGWWGMAVFVATEATLFGTLFGSYFYLRLNTPQWPPAGIAPPKLTLPIVLCAVLVSTSVFMQLAAGAARNARRGAAWAAIFAALFVQAGYFAMQMHLFAHDVHAVAPRQTAYGSIYVTMLGTHHAHVLVGMLLNVWLLLRLATGLTSYRLVAVRAIVFYWHFVNVLALLVLGAQLSAAV